MALEWTSRSPRPVELPEDYQIPAKKESPEADIEMQREEGCLAAIYISERHIPPSPAEHIDMTPYNPAAPVSIIPLTDCYSDLANGDFS
ncbi:hypothetical protein CLU79DRAFT_280301 [Phycomyces nitens]|nr:hypothetical protein CLU79DRAFT_280301 [Phycomyces nitens]